MEAWIYNIQLLASLVKLAAAATQSKSVGKGPIVSYADPKDECIYSLFATGSIFFYLQLRTEHAAAFFPYTVPEDWNPLAMYNAEKFAK